MTSYHHHQFNLGLGVMTTKCLICGLVSQSAAMPLFVKELFLLLRLYDVLLFQCTFCLFGVPYILLKIISVGHSTCIEANAK